MLKLWHEMAREAGLGGLYVVGTANHAARPADIPIAGGHDQVSGIAYFFPTSLASSHISGHFLQRTAVSCHAPNARVVFNQKKYGSPPSCDCFLDHLAGDELDANLKKLVTLASSGMNNATLTYIRGAMPAFSDFPRRKRSGWAFCSDPSPRAYGRLIQRQLERSLDEAGGVEACASTLATHAPTTDHRRSYKHFVLTNAFNEWSEQAVMEPSEQFGFQFLQAHFDAVSNLSSRVQAMVRTEPMTEREHNGETPSSALRPHFREG